MDSGLLGGGVVIALAAVLWLAYLIPGWISRREYLATERNVVRLQQTMRILAETDEVPDEVRLEASARQVSETRRLLKERQRHSRRVAKQRLRDLREANKRSEEQLMTDSLHTSGTSAARERRRRGRAAATFIAAVGLAICGAGIASVLISGSWMPVIAGLLLVAGSVAMLVRLNRPLPQTGAGFEARGETGPVFDYASDPAVLADQAAARQWTPQPLPKPLHLSEGTAAAGAMASVDAAAQMRRAIERAKMELRAAERAEQAGATPVPKLNARAQSTQAEPTGEQPAAQSVAAAPTSAPTASEDATARPSENAHDPRLAAMGVVDEQDTAFDVNEVLRRRRVV